MISEQDLRDIIDIVEAHDIYLLFDETYRELEFQKPLPPL